jgi:iron complex outermembrane receptor protein
MRSGLVVSGLLLSVSSIACTAALAQESGAGGETSTDATLSEIVVTAQRRSERLQDVPVSISAVSGNEIASRRIEKPGDIAQLAPNLQAQTPSSDGAPVYALRGVSMSDYSGNQQGPVATYFDEVYKGTFALLPVSLYDLERVEVLRGPQGTLYGKNTTGGAVNVISRTPGFDTEGYVSVGYGNYNRREANGAVQTPLGDKLAVRVAFTLTDADGWFKNVLPGKEDMNATRQYGVRASLLYKATDTLDFLLRAQISLSNPTTYGIFGRPIGDGIEGFYTRQGLGRYQLAAELDEPEHHRTDGISLTTNWAVSDGLKVTSVTSYDTGNFFFAEDSDGSPLAAVEAPILLTRSEQFSQDLRLASDGEGPFNYIVGAYYNREKLTNTQELRFYNDVDVNGDGVLNYQDCLSDPSFLVGCQYENSFNQIKKTAAAYGDLNFKLTDRLILRGGLRYTHDEGSVSNYIAQLLGSDGTVLANTVPGGPNLDSTTGASFRNGNVSGKVGIDYKLTAEQLLYASYSRGYRGQAFNAQAFFSPTELDVAKAETVDAFEAGFKSQFADRTITFNGSGFYYKYQNQQALSVDPTTAAQTLNNIPRSRIVGAELELTVRPIKRFELNAGLGILSTKIQSGVISGVNLEGNQLPNAPHVSGSVGFNWDVVNSSSGTVKLAGDVNFSSKRYFELDNVERLAQKSYAMADARLEYRTASDHYGVSLWGKNIFNKYYFTSAIDFSGFGYDLIHLGEPRTYGVSVDAKF